MFFLLIFLCVFLQSSSTDHSSCFRFLIF
jgi:hypothetical protein